MGATAVMLPQTKALGSDTVCFVYTVELFFGQKISRPICVCAAVGKHAQRFRDGQGFVYLRDFLNPGDREIVLRGVKKWKAKAKREQNSLAENRLGVQLSKNDEIVRVFHRGEVVAKIQRTLENSLLLPADFPIEVRFYVPGSAMDWHRDDQLYVEPQIEAVYTVSNESDSRTEWIDIKGNQHAESTEPNSLILVQANSALHRVTKLRRGERAIVKVVYTATAEKTENFDRCSRSYVKR